MGCLFFLGIRSELPVKIFAEERFNRLFKAFVHGLALGLFHARYVVEIGRVLDREHLPAVIRGIDRERVLDTVSEFELLPDEAFVHGKGVYGAVPETFLVRVEQRTGVLEDQYTAEIAAAEGASNRPGLIRMDFAALGALFRAVSEYRSLFFENTAVFSRQIGKDFVEMRLDVLHFLVRNDAGPVAALRFAVIADHIACIRAGEYLRVYQHGRYFDKVFFCGHDRTSKRILRIPNCPAQLCADRKTVQY